MRAASRILTLLVCLVFLAPTALAEFGNESEDGWPIDAHGHEVRPPVDPVQLLEAPDPLNKVGPFTAYPYYPILVAELQRLALDHPDKVRLHSAGKSTAQLDLWYLEIADFARIEAGEGVPLEDREVVYLDGGTHSNEYSGVYFVTEVAQFLLDEYETNATAQWIVENRHSYILPMVNPDGSNLFGRLNAKTVNINRNFPGSWGTVDENPIVNNPGPEPASEPETQAVIALMEAIQPDYVNSIHCCGNLWLHPYGAEQLGDAPDIEMYTRICDEVFDDVRDDCGPIWSTIYPASGTTADEGYIRMGASSWTYEMSGRGAVAPWGQPAIVEDVRVQERESWRGVIHAFLNVHLYGAFPVIQEVIGTADELVVTVKNDGWGPLVAGNVTIRDATAAIPFVGPGNATRVVVAGSFEAGETALVVDWQKRIWEAPQETRSHVLTLLQDGDGLIGVVGDTQTERLVPIQEIGVDTPAPMVPLVLLAIVAAVLLATRRR